MKLIISILICGIIFQSCSRKCGCAPPGTDTNWKIVKRNGGISGTDVVLSDDQKNTVLTINTSGSFICKNMVTGTTVSGTIRKDDFNSIYGYQKKFIFSPKLPMLTEEFLILIDNPAGKMVFGDNYTDGYFTTFEAIP